MRTLMIIHYVKIIKHHDMKKPANMDYHCLQVSFDSRLYQKSQFMGVLK